MALLPIVRTQLLSAARRLAAAGRFARRFHPARWLGLTAAVTVLATVSGCGGSGDTVASVAGRSIAPATFRHWLRIVAAESGEGASGLPKPPHYAACIRRLRSSSKSTGTKKPTTSALESRCAARYETLKATTLGFLIPADWLLAEAQSLRVKLTDAEVKKQFLTAKNSRFPHASEFEQFLAHSRYTVSDLLLRVKLQMMGQRVESAIVKRHKHVTEAEVARYYREHQSNFGTPEKRAVYIILTKTEAAARGARRAIESGRSFASVAKKVSIDPTSKTTGGLLPEVIKGEEEKSLDEAIFSARRGVLGGPLKTSFGWYVFEVKSIKAGNQPSLSQVKTRVRAEVASANESKALHEFLAGFKKRWMARTDCRGGYVVAECSGYRPPRKR